jgi:hypothetical protein
MNTGKNAGQPPPPGYKWDNGYLVNDEGQRIYGDHDLMGAYKPSTADNEDGSAYDPAGSNGSKWRAGLNDDIGQPPAMVQHGANDDYRDPVTGEPNLPPPPDVDPVTGAKGWSYTVIDENGNVTKIPTTAALQQYYEDNGIPWPYGNYKPTCPIAK